ncbi:threonine ammonia-lyase [Sphingomonas astaxanthinifaciens]|uniref:Serine/threonine dehydratase n=1 Tax=Sphingomonas astaxanthinifaciens DSM 22298 TaxID=1123267 RepID=A0ABQ5Z926_9SPHN|nr:threonine/serine dehydratase [Sphingomonas astaxanthinifaciens]GLR48437.1 serine/threonine dehydratase [Sphingomonas astaxanthinifaciens DSM 22298]
MKSNVNLPTREDVLAASERIAGLVERTPLREVEIGGHRLWLKCESMQTGGSFKLRGASNRLALLNESERRAGVVAFSSGNHAQGVAIAARRLGIPATIVMPSDAPRPKVEGTRAQGAEIVFYDREREDRVAIAEALAAERGAVVVPSFDDRHIIAGQGTAGLEILEQCPEPVHQIVVCCGGGGLAAGIALACPDADIVTVEPQGWDDMARSYAAGAIVPVGPNPPPTRCDALQTPRVSPLTFGILQARGARGLAVSEDEVRAAVRFAWHELEMIVEPGGAAALAAVLAGKLAPEAGTVVLVTGSNVDPALHAALVG